MSKKILIIGNSIKEYALAKNLSKKYQVFVAPGNELMQDFATVLDIREDSVTELLDFVMENDIDLTIPISEKALKTNIVEIFVNNQQQIFASDKNVSRFLFDKSLIKKTLYKLRIPTPKFGIFEKQNMAFDYIKNQKTPFVVKSNEASSAIIINSANLAKSVIDTMFNTGNQKVIIEDYIWGTPFSFYVLTDGYKALSLGSSLIYKHSLEGDGGQLTSGMGSCSPNYKLSYENEFFIMDNVIYPLLEYFEREHNAYLGILGIDAILSDEGEIFVLGIKNFMQECDTTAILDLLENDIYSLFEACVIGSFSDEVDDILIKDLSAVSLSLMCKNKDSKNNVINGIENLDEDISLDFNSNTYKNKYLEYEVNTGLNAVLTAKAHTVNSALKKAYEEVSELDYEGLYYRKDIAKSFNA